MHKAWRDLKANRYPAHGTHMNVPRRNPAISQWCSKGSEHVFERDKSNTTRTREVSKSGNMSSKFF